MSVDYVQCGPEDTDFVPRLPFGQLLYTSLNRSEYFAEVALIDSTSGKEVTRKQLLEESVPVAINLRNLGIKEGDVITIVSQNNVRYLITILGAAFVGATINLLNCDYTGRELRHFFSLCQPKLIVSSRKSLANVLEGKSDLGSRVLLLDDLPTAEEEKDGVQSFQQVLSTEVSANEIKNFEPAKNLDPNEDVAFILTSSGTTGFPKAVMVTHTNVRVGMMYIGSTYFLDINSQESTVVYLPLFHIYGTLVSTSTILFRSKIVLMEKFVPDQFLSIIQDFKITKLFTVPPVLLFLINTPLLDKYDFSSVKDVFCGAACLHGRSEEAAIKRLGIRSVLQIYGMTESGGAMLIMSRNEYRSGSVGKPVFTFQVKICDPETEEILGPGQVGEIRAKGEGLMKGYLGNEKETANAFDSDGFLKSGDMGYYDQDGYFYVVDRLKEIIKYKGFQVPPVEVESILLTHPSIKDAGVIGIPDERAGELPLAFVVKQPGKEVTEEEILAYVAENISVQKQLHGGVRFVEEIPKGPSGKILRRKLQELLKKKMNDD